MGLTSATVSGVTRPATDPYEVLGVPRSASADEVKRAYREKALQYHPDRNPGDAVASERFRTISEAYATLRDPEARRRFDAYGHVGRSPGAATPDFSHVDWRVVFQEAGVPFDWSRGGGIPSTGNVVFDVLFRGMTTMFRQAGLLPGVDRELPLRIDLATARAGGSVRVNVPGPIACSSCGGVGRDAAGACAVCGGAGVLRNGMPVEVRVPPGVRHGTRLRLARLGGPGQPPGDAYVVIAVDLPAGAALRGGDLLTDLFVTPLEAARGAVATVFGVPVQVGAGSVDGEQVRVAGGGIGGDLVVTLRTDILRGLGRAAGEWLRSVVWRRAA
jgi:molecular chaperone DnaJ